MRIVTGYSPSIEEFGLRRPLPGREQDEVLCYGTVPEAPLQWDPTVHSYPQLVAQYPAGWKPDTVFFPSLEYHPVPEGIEHADCLTVGFVGDWNLGAQAYQQVGNMFDLLIADRNGCDRLRAAGLQNVRYAPLWAFDPRVHRRMPGVERDLDVVMIGSLNYNVQRERSRWVARVAKLSGKHTICITSGVFGDDYTRLLNRAKIVFNRSIRGEINMRAYEAPACGALLFYERTNREIGDLFTDRADCVLYGEDDLEELLEYYLAPEHAEERERIAEAGWRKVQAQSYAHHAAQIAATIEQALNEMPNPRPRRTFCALSPADQALHRAYQYTLVATRTVLPAAERLLARAETFSPSRADVANARACALAEWGIAQGDPILRDRYLRQAIECARRAFAMRPGYATALFNLAQIQGVQASAEREGTLRATLHALEAETIAPEQVEGPYFPHAFDTPFLAEMEMAWAQNPVGTDAWTIAVRDLMRWRVCEQLSDLAFSTGRIQEAEALAAQAVLRCPNIGTSRYRWARTLHALGRLEEATTQYRTGMAEAPLMPEVWEAFAGLLIEQSRWEECRDFLAELNALLNGCPLFDGWRPTWQYLRTRLNAAQEQAVAAATLRLLALPDWNAPTQWQTLLQRYVSQFQPGDPVHLLLPVEQARVETLVRELSAFLETACHTTLEDIPDISLLTDTMTDTSLLELTKNAHFFILLTEQTVALLPQTAVLPTLTVEALSRALLPDLPALHAPRQHAA